MVRGLGKKQKQLREITRRKILEFLQYNEPANYSQIAKGGGIVDRDSVRESLDELQNDNLIASNILSIGKDRRSHGTYYYRNPPLPRIQYIISKEKYYSKLGSSYFYGIKSDIPLAIQYEHKLNYLVLEKKSFFIQSKNKLNRLKTEHSELFLPRLGNFKKLNARLLYFQNIDIKIKLDKWGLINNTPFKKPSDSLLKKSLMKMDDLFNEYKEIKSTKLFPGLIQLKVAEKLVERSIRNVMKQYNVSPKVGAKLKKDLFNVDGSVRIRTINSIYEKITGKKKDPRLRTDPGEFLERKRKALEKS